MRAGGAPISVESWWSPGTGEEQRGRSGGCQIARGTEPDDARANVQRKRRRGYERRPDIAKDGIARANPGLSRGGACYGAMPGTNRRGARRGGLRLVAMPYGQRDRRRKRPDEAEEPPGEPHGAAIRSLTTDAR